MEGNRKRASTGWVEEETVAMHGWNGRWKLVALIVSSASLVFSTGCKTSSFSSMPGFGWLSWNRDKSPSTFLAGNDPSGHLPPPSAATDPYVQGARTPAANSSYGPAMNVSAPTSGYPSTGYPTNGPTRQTANGYQTGPYKTGSTSNRSPGYPYYRGQSFGQTSRAPNGSTYESGSGTRYGTTGLSGGADRYSNNTYSDNKDSNDRYSNDRYSVNNAAPQPYGGERDSADTYRSQGFSRPATEPDRYADDYYSGRRRDATAAAPERDSQYGFAPSSRLASQPDDERGLNAYAASEDRYPADTGRPLGDQDLRVAENRMDASRESTRNEPANYESRETVAPSHRTSEPWRPGTTSEYLEAREDVDSSHLQPASHLSNVSTREY